MSNKRHISLFLQFKWKTIFLKNDQNFIFLNSKNRFLEKRQLIIFCFLFLAFDFTAHYIHISILFFRNHHYSYRAFLRCIVGKSSAMHLSIVEVIAKPSVHGKLYHIIPVVYHKLSEVRSNLSLCFCHNGQIKEYYYPHKFTHRYSCDLISCIIGNLSLLTPCSKEVI